MNLKVTHPGMPWPLGTVIAEKAFGDPTRHLELGALEWTREPATVEGVIADVSTLDDDELVAENKRLKAMLDSLPCENAKLKDANATLVKANEKLVKDLADMTADRDLQRESSVHEQHMAKQRMLDNPQPSPVS